MTITVNGVPLEDPVIPPNNINGIILGNNNNIVVSTTPQNSNIIAGGVVSVGNTGVSPQNSTVTANGITVGNTGVSPQSTNNPVAVGNIIINNPTGNSNVIQPKPSTTTSVAPSTVAKANQDAKLNPISVTKFATPSPKIAISKQDLERMKAEIQKLEKQTNLNLLPYLLGGELARIKHQFSDLNINKYYLLLCLLVYGFDNNTMSASIGQDHAKYIMDDQFIKDFQTMIKIPQLADILKKTPAYAKGCFDDLGQLGNIAANGDRMENNPITGATRYTPSLVTNAMEKICPGSVSGLEKFCNTIRTRAYLSMPKRAFGSIQKVMRIVNGVVVSFNKLINGFYKQLMKYIKKVYAFINGIIKEIQDKLMQIIEGIIPLDLICLLLDTVQCILDDIYFFGSLFNMSGPFFNYVNIVQTFVNTASNFVQNPFETLKAYLPPEVSKLIDTVEQIGTDPEGFVSDTLSNMGMSYVNTALQGDIVGALMEHYGTNYATMSSPLANVMSKAAAIWERYSADGSKLPTTMSDLTAPNLFNDGNENIFGEPIDKNNIIKNLKEDFKSISKDISTLPSDISKDLGPVGSSLNKFASSLNPFKNKKENVNEDEGYTDGRVLSDGTPVARPL
jgi:hypothetical protein